jgi:hypothetical protein
MGYRSQSGESQFRGSTQPQQDNVGQQIVGSVVDVVGTELINIGRANRLRKEVNSQLAQESMKNQELLMNEIGGFGKVDGDSPEVGPDSKNLQDIFTGVVSELSKAQLNLSQHGNATYTYKYIDPDTGEESMRTREDDEAIVNSNKNLIRSAQDLIGAHEYNVGVVETAIEEGKIGNDRGQIPLNKIDPYVYAAALAGNALNGQAVKERYFFEKDENGNRVMMIELKGQSIAQVNKARGVEGDTHVMNLKRLSEIQSSVSSLPNNSAGSNTAHDYTEQVNQSLQKAGAWKEGQFTENFYIDDPDEITDISGRTKITSKVKAFDYNAAKQSTDATAKALSQQSGKGGPDQILIDIAAYSVKTTDPETGEVVFSLVPGPEISEDGLILYNEDRSPKMKEPIRLLDDDGLFIQENFPGQKIEDVLKDVIQQSILLDGGAYNSQEKIKVASSTIPDSDDSGGDGDVDTSLFQILSTTVDDDPDSFMLGGEDRVFEVKNLSLGQESDMDTKFSGIGRDGEGAYVIVDGKKERDDKKYNFYKNAIIESVDKNEKPAILARFEELEEMTPSKSVNIEEVVDIIANEAGKAEYQTTKGGALGFKGDDEEKFADYLKGLGFDPDTFNESELEDISFDEKNVIKKYIKELIYKNDKNKNVARKMLGKDAGANKSETEKTKTEVQTTGNSMSKF